MRSVLYIVGPILALLVAFGVWRAVLPACAASPWLGLFTPADCPAPPSPASLAAAAEAARGEALRAEVRRLERELASRAACDAAPVVGPGDPLDAGLWEASDLAALDGCWALGGGVARADPVTGRVSAAETWRMCFDGAGAGTQTLAFPDGALCEGPVAASFRDDGTLALADAEPAACEPGPALDARRGSCAMDVYSRVVCVFRDGASSIDATLRRAE